MNLPTLLDLVREEIDAINVKSPNDIIDIVTDSKSFPKLMLLIKNSEKSQKVIYTAASGLLNFEDEDVWVGVLFTLLVKADCERYAILLSRALTTGYRGKWASGLALSYLISRRLNDKRLRISA